MDHRSRVLGLVLAVVLAAAGACTDDPRELETEDLQRLIERGLDEADEPNALHFTEDEAECVAERVVRAISDDRLRALGADEGFGLSTLDFSPGEQAIVFEALQVCVDLAAQVTDTLEEDSGLSREQAACMAEGYVASDAFREAIFSQEFDEGLNDRIDDALAQAAQACRLGPDLGPT